MFNISSSNIKLFQDYMVFFEHAKYLKSTGIINRGLVSPEVISRDSIMKRVSSVMLKGMRAENCFNIKETMVNNLQHVKLASVNRVRRISRLTDFNFVLNYDFERFIDDEFFSPIDVKAITSSTHKQRFAASIFGDIENEEVIKLLNDYEFVFMPCPLWGNVEGLICNLILGIRDNLNHSYSLGARENRGRIILNNLDIFIDPRFKYSNYHWNTYKTYGTQTLIALYNKYALGEDIRIPGIGNPASFKPVLSIADIKEINIQGRDIQLCSLANTFYDIKSRSCLFLIKKRIDDTGPYLAPNLINGSIKFEYKVNRAFIDDPERFYKAAYDFNDRLKKAIVGIG